MSQLTVYAVPWCPHCRAAIAFLEKRHIPFRYVDMDSADPDTEKKIIEVNGGDDWVVPTLEYDGRFLPGQPFSEEAFVQALHQLGVLPSA